MTDEMLSKALFSDITTQLHHNQKEFAKLLASVVPEDYKVDETLLAMLDQTVKFTSLFTAQFVIRFLEAHGDLNLPPDGSPILYPISKE